MREPGRILSIDGYDWTGLLQASQAEVYNMVNRLLTEFQAGTNRFDGPGEALFVHLHGNAVVGVAGLNVEQETCFGRAGRIRRLYVIPSCRRQGLGRSLVAAIESSAAGEFETLTVNVGVLSARAFYESLGFEAVVWPGITHIKRLVRDSLGAKLHAPSEL